MASILEALKKKFNAKGRNIAEAIENAEIGGGSGENVIEVLEDYTGGEPRYTTNISPEEFKKMVVDGIVNGKPCAFQIFDPGSNAASSLYQVSWFGHTPSAQGTTESYNMTASSVFYSTYTKIGILSQTKMTYNSNDDAVSVETISGTFKITING